jgi:hypothetical protein
MALLPPTSHLFGHEVRRPTIGSQIGRGHWRATQAKGIALSDVSTCGWAWGIGRRRRRRGRGGEERRRKEREKEDREAKGGGEVRMTPAA